MFGLLGLLVPILAHRLFTTLGLLVHIGGQLAGFLLMLVGFDNVVLEFQCGIEQESDINDLVVAAGGDVILVVHDDAFFLEFLERPLDSLDVVARIG